MIALALYQRPPSIFGEVLHASEENEPSELGGFLWQGATIGAALMFAYPVAALLSITPYYGYLFVGALPLFLAEGIGFGVLEGTAIWACTYLTGHRLNALARAALGVVVLFLLLIAVNFLFSGPSPYDKDVSATVYLFYIGVYSACGVIFGLVTGSRFDPLHELIRGTTPPRWGVLAAITGFALRISVILFLMYSVLILIWMLRGRADRTEFTYTVIALSHFIAAAVIVFARMPFWLLLPLALIINFPIAAYVTEVLAEDAVEMRAITLGYLHLWAAFLFCRLSVPRPAVSFFKKKSRLIHSE